MPNVMDPFTDPLARFSHSAYHFPLLCEVTLRTQLHAEASEFRVATAFPDDNTTLGWQSAGFHLKRDGGATLLLEAAASMPMGITAPPPGCPRGPRCRCRA